LLPPDTAAPSTHHPCEPFTWFDAELSPLQQAAVRNGLTAQPGCLITGWANTGKARIAVELLRQTLHRGGRVLLVHPHAERLTHWLRTWGQLPGVVTYHCGHSYAERRHHLHTHTVPHARGRWHAAKQQLAQAQTTRAELAALADGSAPMPTSGSLADLGTALAAWNAARVQQHADQTARIAQLEQQQATQQTIALVLAQQQADLAPLATAYASGKWWTGAYWQGWQRGKILEQFAAVAAQQRQADEALERITTALAEVQTEATQAEQTAQAERTQLLTQAMQSAEQAVQSATHALESARPWCQWLEQHGDEVLQRWLHAVNLIAATPNSLAADTEWPRQRPVDLLLVPEGSHLTEAEWTALTRHARRWVVLVDPALCGPMPNKPARGRRGEAEMWWLRYWHTHHTDAWVRAGEWLVARMRAERTEPLEVECLADAPEIELRIDPTPATGPVLAEVAFPTQYAVRQAVEILFRETDELPLQTRGEGFTWETEPERIVLRLGTPPLLPAAIVPLAPGVTARVTEMPTPGARSVCRPPIACVFSALEFAGAAGWTLERAATWVGQHVRRLDSARTFRLDQPHNQAPALTVFLGDLFYPGAYALPWLPTSSPAEAGVTFVPAPAWPSTQGQWLPAHLKTGAGWECEQAGDWCNPREADVVADWVQHHELASDVTVVTPFAAQARLLRERLAGMGVPVVGPGDAVPARTVSVVVSLVRSHSQRAVAFGTDPAWLARMLARARGRVAVVGDPGTLARRAVWDGPVDGLDEQRAQREKAWIGRLVRYLHGHAPRAAQFRLGGNHQP
jgi:hypothetical protein